MLQFIIKAALSGLIVAAIAAVARRYPGFGALIASLPLISVLGMIWLWQDTRDPVLLADHARATFWFVLPSLPMFLAIPALLGRGWPFRTALIAGCSLTICLYFLMTWAAARLGLRL